MNRLSIQFIRKVDTKKDDDFAIIESNGVDNYTITYTDAITGNPMAFNTNGSGVFRWVRRVLRLLEEDADPFQHIQLNVYAMPSTLFSVATLDKHYETILDAVEYYLDVISKKEDAPSTPQTQRITRECPHAPARRHLFFDEDGNEEFRRPQIVERDFIY
jgi:hypothetical protein